MWRILYIWPDSSAGAVSKSCPIDSGADNPVCRLCWNEAGDPTEGWQLVSPCGCKGSIQFIHLRCLHAWQACLWSQGERTRTLSCDVCKQKYAQSCVSLQICQALSKKEQLKRIVSRMAQSPEKAFRVWRLCIVTSGVIYAAKQGASGFGVGLFFGLKLAQPVVSFLVQLAPEVGVIAALIPSLKPALATAFYVGTTLLGLELVMTACYGLLRGGLCGFCRGAFGGFQLTLGAFKLVGIAVSSVVEQSQVHHPTMFKDPVRRLGNGIFNVFRRLF